MKAVNLSLSFGTNVIYDNAEFNLLPRDKVGIVGVNGAGKTTLFKIILGQVIPDSGYIDTNNANISYLPQQIEITKPDITVWDFLITGRPIAELEAKLNTLYEQIANNPDDQNVMNQISQTQERLEYYNYYHAEDELLEIIDNMQIDSAMLDMKLKNLSGGQKSKVAFARLLYSMSGILLLDEPTNHLDPETQMIIGDNFRDYKGTIILVSHNPEFVEQIGITRMLVLPSGKIEDYSHELLEYYYKTNTKE